jgi:hypothetical protein
MRQHSLEEFSMSLGTLPTSVGLPATARLKRLSHFAYWLDVSVNNIDLSHRVCSSFPSCLPNLGSGSNYFELLRTYIITGFLSDPDLGGNKDMLGWKVIGFDGMSAHQPPFGYYDAELLKSQAAAEEKK